MRQIDTFDVRPLLGTCTQNLFVTLAAFAANIFEMSKNCRYTLYTDLLHRVEMTSCMYKSFVPFLFVLIAFYNAFDHTSCYLSKYCVELAVSGGFVSPLIPLMPRSRIRGLYLHTNTNFRTQ